MATHVPFVSYVILIKVPDEEGESDSLYVTTLTALAVGAQTRNFVEAFVYVTPKSLPV